MKNRNLIIGAMVLIALGSLFLFIDSRQEEKKPEEITAPAATTKSEEHTFFTTETSQVDSFIIKNEQEELAFFSENGNWHLEGYEQAELNQSIIHQVQNTLAKVPYIEKWEGEVLDGRYGLDNPRASLEFIHSDGTQSGFSLGKKNPGGTAFYARRDDDSAVYLIPYYMGQLLLRTAFDFRPTQFPSIQQESLTHLQLKTKNNYLSIIPYQPINSFFPEFFQLMIDEPFSEQIPVNDFALDEWFSHWLQPLVIIDFRDDLTPEQAGIDKQNYLYLKDEEGNQIDLYLGDKTENGYLAVKNGSSEVIVISSIIDHLLSVNPFDLTSRFVFIPDITRVARLDFIDHSDNFNFNVDFDWTDNPDDGRFFIEGKELNGETFRKLFQDFISLSFEGDGDSFQLEGDPYYTLIYTPLDNSLTPVLINFYPHDDFYLIYQREGSPSRYLIGRYQFEELLPKVKAYNDYL